MHVYFSVDQRHHGVGPVKYAWDPSGNFLASTGSSRVVHIFDRQGTLVDQIVPPSPSVCTHLEWSNPHRDNKANGERWLTLAVAQANSSVIVLWSKEDHSTHLVDMNVKEITLLKWNKGKSTTVSGADDNCMLLAIGTSKGQVVFYEADEKTGTSERPTLRLAMSKHKKKILCGDWNTQNEFAFGSEDRQITICWKDGSVVDQVKIKAAPVCIQFGGRQSGAVKRVVSVNMGRETILLYDLNEKDNALELAFQARYGDIVDYRWFGQGYIVAGFSLGYVVIISTRGLTIRMRFLSFVQVDMNEIGQEQYCAKFHETHLHAICYNEVNGMVATLGDSCLKVVRMVDWKEIAVEDLNREAAAFDDLRWTGDGRVLSVSCHTGALLHFKLLHMEQACAELDFAPTAHLLTAVLAPFTPAVLLVTVVSMLGGLTLLASVALQVSVPQLLQAMTGLCVRL
ncbi:Aste57867_22951 [Aphanomyces stellatus]|uniref:Aste57867_22951 protein n=1 Tax=Aphanomyces stellatus TaxID=120398 RepID=A0A485LN08_9STRA|nr:hypothetical protein As57867_022880 [Aphanomyces stellatus]VFT99601.1 Aste57867_22951 [Aphanomyces stellatus]